MDKNKQTLAYHDVTSVMKNVINIMNERAEESKENAVGIIQSTGFDELDKQIKGFERDELIFFSAKQGMGKTSIALTAIIKKVKEEKVPVLYYSTNTPEEIAIRLISMESGIDLDIVRGGIYSKEEAVTIGTAMDEIKTWPLFIGGLGDVSNESVKDILPNADALMSGANYDVEDIMKYCIRIKYNEGIGCVIIDDFDFMDPSENVNITGFTPEKKAAEYEEMLKRLKRLALRMRCPIIVLSNYLGEDIDEKYESLNRSDLKEYGRVEKFADKVLLLSRVIDEKSNDYVYRIVVARNNKGPAGSITLDLDTNSLHMNER